MNETYRSNGGKRNAYIIVVWKFMISDYLNNRDGETGKRE